MSTTLRKPMTREEFFEWAEGQNERYEFDGEQPVLMTGGTASHARLQLKLLIMLTTHLSGSPFEALGPDMGLETVGRHVRYPDVVVTRGFTQGNDRIVSDPVAVFEVLSPSTSRTDRITKLREYGAVESIRTYAILETDSPAVMVFQKDAASQWTALALEADGVLSVPEIGVDLPLAELYAGLFG